MFHVNIMVYQLFALNIMMVKDLVLVSTQKQDCLAMCRQIVCKTE